MSLSADGRANYSSLTNTEKATVRDEIVEDLRKIRRDLAVALARATLQTDLLDTLEAFVIANASDFTAAERTDLTTARDAIRTQYATAANNVTGVTASYTAP